MSIFDYFTSSNDKYLDIIFDSAERGVTQMEFNYKEATLFGRYEIFLFNAVVAWSYFLNNDLLKPNQNLVNKMVSRLEKSMNRFGVDFDNELMMTHYKLRYEMVKSEMAKIERSHVESTKHYSVYFLHIMYYEPLNPKPQLARTKLKETELLRFTNALIDLHNWVLLSIQPSNIIKT